MPQENYGNLVDCFPPDDKRESSSPALTSVFIEKEPFSSNLVDSTDFKPLIQCDNYYLTKGRSRSQQSSGISMFEARGLQKFKFIFYALGIFLCYFIFGIFQEKITRTKYGEAKEVFTYTLSLVFVQCLVNALFAKFITRVISEDSGRDTTPQKLYISSAMTYLTAMVSSNYALRYVNYPTQVIGKSCKPIPVMILGVLYARKSYPLKKYLFVMMIVAGVVLFMWKDQPATKVAPTTDSSSVLGYFFLIFSLAMDGLTGGLQDRMRGEHKTRFSPMMLYMNVWSTLFLGIAIILTSEIWSFIEFIQRFPLVINDIFWFSVLSALGQLFIFLTVAEYGPLSCSVVTTTRKFFTVLVSIIYFGNPASIRQWAGTILVFMGIALDNLKGKEPKSPPKEKSEEKALIK